MGYYTRKSCLASLFPDIFNKCLPAGALAFAATAVSFHLLIHLFLDGSYFGYQLTAAINKYATGVRIAGKFRHEDYSKINEQFLGMIEEVEKVPHCLQSLHKVLKKIAAQGW